MAIYGLLWQNIDLIGLESSFLEVTDPNSFGLVNKKVLLRNFGLTVGYYSLKNKAKMVLSEILHPSAN